MVWFGRQSPPAHKVVCLLETAISVHHLPKIIPFVLSNTVKDSMIDFKMFHIWHNKGHISYDTDATAVLHLFYCLTGFRSCSCQQALKHKVNTLLLNESSSIRLQLQIVACLLIKQWLVYGVLRVAIPLTYALQLWNLNWCLNSNFLQSLAVTVWLADNI